MKTSSICVLLPSIATLLILDFTSALPTPSEENPTTPSEYFSTTSQEFTSTNLPSTPTEQPLHDLTTTPSSTSVPASSSKKSETSPIPPTVEPLAQPKGRNMFYGDPYDGPIIFAAMPNAHMAPDYPEPIITYKQPVDGLNYDYAADVLPEAVFAPEPVKEFRNGAAAYPPETIHDSDLSTAESNIVFRPLFAYRRKTAKRRRIYSRPSASASSSNKNERRGSNGYSRYPYYYPAYYVNAEFEHVA